MFPYFSVLTCNCLHTVATWDVSASVPAAQGFCASCNTTVTSSMSTATVHVAVDLELKMFLGHTNSCICFACTQDALCIVFDIYICTHSPASSPLKPLYHQFVALSCTSAEQCLSRCSCVDLVEQMAYLIQQVCIISLQGAMVRTADAAAASWPQ